MIKIQLFFLLKRDMHLVRSSRAGRSGSSDRRDARRTSHRGGGSPTRSRESPKLCPFELNFIKFGHIEQS